MRIKEKITFRLRERRDRDLITALKWIEEGDLSELIRQGLRHVLQSQAAAKPVPAIKSAITPDNVGQQAQIKKQPIVWDIPK